MPSSTCEKDHGISRLVPHAAGNSAGPRERLLALAELRTLSKYVALIASLGIADQIGDSQVNISELAKKLNINEDKLYRMMSYVAGAGVFTELDGRCFANNDVSKEYRKPEVVAIMELYNSPSMLSAYTETDFAITTNSNENAFQKANGCDAYTYFASHPDEEKRFQQGVAAYTTFQANIPNIYDFSGYSTVCEIAGGRGLFLKSILAKNPKTSGILFDLPVVESHVWPELKSEFKDRFQFAGGSFFEVISCNADLYSIAMTLHCFNNATVTKILSNIAEAMKRHPTKAAKLLIVESDYNAAKPNEPHPLRNLDAMMLACMDGCERTSEDWNKLTAAAKLVVKKRVPFPPFFVGYECELAN